MNDNNKVPNWVEEIKLFLENGEHAISLYKLRPEIYFIQKKGPDRLDSSNGMLILTDKGIITYDLNVDEKRIDLIYEYFKPIKHYAHFNTHFHVDHASHMHFFREKMGCKLYSPSPDLPYIASEDRHRIENGYDDAGVGKEWHEFVVEQLKYNFLDDLIAYEPDDIFNFTNKKENTNIKVETISFPSHSKGHVGFHYIIENNNGKKKREIITNKDKSPQKHFLYFTDLGIDEGLANFGPWYGFPWQSVKDMYTDLDKANNIHKKYNCPMFSSHGIPYWNYTPKPYEYVKEKIEVKAKEVISVMEALGGQVELGEILKHRIIYPIDKLKGAFGAVVRYWNKGFIQNLLDYLIEQKKIMNIGENKYQIIQ